MAHYGVSPVLFESVSAVTQTPTVDLGTRRIEAGEEYVYCYNTTGSAVTQGALMIASGGSGYSVTRSSTASADFPVCAVKNAALASGDYFWGLVRGASRVMSVAVAAGDLLGIGADGKLNTLVTGSFPTGTVVGKALDAATANTQPLVLLSLYG